ncbi:MAG: hypothetical protein U5N85_21910 [Arcicella sp.]|nr:hypothetical protein [Arcicella sp.]
MDQTTIGGDFADKLYSPQQGKEGNLSSQTLYALRTLHRLETLNVLSSVFMPKSTQWLTETFTARCGKRQVDEHIFHGRSVEDGKNIVCWNARYNDTRENLVRYSKKNVLKGDLSFGKSK